MKIENAIEKIKAAGHDISDEYSVDDCIGFLNAAIQEISAQLIAAKSPSMVNEISLHDQESLPTNFVRPAGTYPMKITGNTVSFFDDTATIRFRYFATKPFIADSTGDMPFVHDALNDCSVRAAVLLALNQNEYDITQDKSLSDEIKGAIAQGISG